MRRMSEEELLNVLRKVAAEQGKTPSAVWWNKQHLRPSVLCYMQRFGSWNRALTLAGLPLLKDRTKYSREELIGKLHAKARELGRTPSAREMAQPSAKIYQNMFGGWEKALEAAGLDPLNAHHTKEEILEEIKKRAEEMERVPRYCDMGPSITRASKKYWTKWTDALIEAGIVRKEDNLAYYNTKDGWHNEVTPNQCIESIRRLGERLGRAPSVEEMDKNRDTVSVYVCRLRFGTWRAALAAAGYY